eukprot:TRINITY_DN2030_c0_g1_i1.p1 TRINITY_DN2030_c0_g1~~TRINITY_DN2030_c0_g1_i1.p1  ORF type:complete len:181 (+),score=51.66 TRINITY_DN2030_c0_g1_i1:203-745(+)
MEDTKKQIEASIAKVPNFPKPGILFYDVTTIFSNPSAFHLVLDSFESELKNVEFDAFVAAESRGFILGAPLADRMGKPLLLARKKGKLPRKTLSGAYDLEYGSAEIEIHVDDVHEGMKIVVVDDLIATGGTLKCTIGLLESLGCTVPKVIAIIGLVYLPYRDLLKDYDVSTLITYDTEHV